MPVTAHAAPLSSRADMFPQTSHHTKRHGTSCGHHRPFPPLLVAMGGSVLAFTFTVYSAHGKIVARFR